MSSIFRLLKRHISVSNHSFMIKFAYSIPFRIQGADFTAEQASSQSAASAKTTKCFEASNQRGDTKSEYCEAQAAHHPHEPPHRSSIKETHHRR
jgi:hypothetical protein